MDGSSHRELKALIDKYPYFEVAHLLLLKNLHDKQSVRFKEELKNSSLHISDRRQLFLLIQNQIVVAPLSKESDLSEKESDERVLPVNIDVEEKRIVNSNTASNPEKSKPEIDVLFDLAGEIDIVEEQDQAEFNQSGDQDMEMLELSEPEAKAEKAKIESENTYKPSTTDSQSLLAGSELYDIGYGGNLYTLGEEDKEKTEEVIIDDGHSFLGWMNLVDKKELEENQDDENASNPEQKTPKKGNDLIDDFIQNEPRIKRNIKVVEKQEDISKDSILENDGFMSETLATIYVNQRLFDKAIAVYEKLVLKNPEKNIYFASQIERIEKLKNNK
ncbi:hypothetical protein DLK05_15980 [Ancylomarina longa]|uniref:Tetratricopeptide repeat protein n=2 Tax=Ancylomarina longa TaxID=2487017 RepID=A0A434AEV5_9BACT|nr:hypothetical protein DLK05_15980 [Ancylomarina longa]